MNEEGSIISVFLEALPCSNTDEQGDMMRLPTETLMVVEIRMVLVMEF
jgi:hypothetical protein